MGGSGGATPSVCGDGNLASDEECDDGNMAAGDACSATCTRTVFDIASGAPIINDGPDVGPSDAGFAVVWRQNDAGSYSILQAVYEANGIPGGAPGTLLPSTTEIQDKPRMGTNSTRRSVAAWRDPVNNAIRFHVIEPGGTPSGAGLQAIGSSPSVAVSDVGVKNSGEFCLVWTTASSTVLARTFDPLGSIPPTPTQSIGTTNGQGVPGIWSSGLQFVAAWNHADGVLRGQGLDAEGVPQGSAFKLPSNNNENRTSVGIPVGAQGAHVVVYEQLFGSGPSAFTRVTMRRFANLTTPAALESFVSSSADHDEEGAAMADANGKFVVAWADNNVNFGDILAQVFDQMGEPLGPPILVNSTAPGGTQRAAKVAANSDGDVMFVWESDQAGVTKVSALIYPRLLPP